MEKIQLLARSLVAVMAINILIGLIGGVAAFSQSGDDSRWLTGLGVLSIVWIGILGFSLRDDETTLIKNLLAWLAPPRIHIVSGLLAVFILGMLLFGLYGVLETFSGQPQTVGVVFLLWSVIGSLLLGAMYPPQQILRPVYPVLIGVGVVVIGIIIGEGILHAFDVIEGEEPLQITGEFDPALYNTITDTYVEWAEQYWVEIQEISRLAMWTPYVYWRTSPYDGEHITVNEQGLRYTIPPEGDPEIQIFTFGGSTMWGYGARDEHTIPSELVREMATQGTIAEVTNYGENGYMSQQDVILFQTLLLQGEIPDVAIFYWGYNDINITLRDGYVGATSTEKDNAAQFDGGQCVLDFSTGVMLNNLLYDTMLGSRILEANDIAPINPGEGCQLGNADWENVNADLILEATSEPEDLATYLKRQIQVVQGIGAAYDIQVIIVWHPALYAKEPRSYYEQQIMNQQRWLDFFVYYDQVDDAFREQVEGIPDVLLWSDFFADLPTNINIYIDKVHITEEGNQLIAAALVEHIQSTNALARN